MNTENLNEPLSLADSFSNKKGTPKKETHFFYNSRRRQCLFTIATIWSFSG